MCAFVTSRKNAVFAIISSRRERLVVEPRVAFSSFPAINPNGLAWRLLNKRRGTALDAGIWSLAIMTIGRGAAVGGAGTGPSRGQREGRSRESGVERSSTKQGPEGA